jgi:hypothetical protein
MCHGGMLTATQHRSMWRAGHEPQRYQNRQRLSVAEAEGGAATAIVMIAPQVHSGRRAPTDYLCYDRGEQQPLSLLLAGVLQAVVESYYGAGPADKAIARRVVLHG